MSDYAIVGIGLVDALGNDVAENWKRYISGDVAITPINTFDLSKYPSIKVKEAYQIDETKLQFGDLLPDNERRHMDRYSIVGLYSAMKAIQQCNIVEPKNTAVMFSSLGGGAATTLDCTVGLLAGKRATPRQALATQRDGMSGLISRKFGFYGSNLCLSSACASGILSLDYACRLLSDDTYDQVVVGACDVMVDPMDIHMFQSIGALDTRDKPVCAPFDMNRKGFVMGEGAATFVIKKMSRAISDGDTIYSIIKGIGFANEAFHETAVSSDGVGARISMDMAIHRAGLSRSDIKIANAHVTSTPNGDEVEYNVLKEFFPGITVMGLKANIGHTMAACGLVEMCYLIESMKMSLVGPLANLTNPIGDEINMPTTTETVDAKYAIKNSFGFGGKSAAIVLERP